MFLYLSSQKGAMTVTKVVTVVKTKKGPHTHKKKGELMENDQDAMEVSVLYSSPKRNVYISDINIQAKMLISMVLYWFLKCTVHCLKCDWCVWQYSSEEEEVDLQTALTGFQTKQRKLLEPVDHQKIQYEPYRRNFYVEVPELAKMTPEGT